MELRQLQDRGAAMLVMLTLGGEGEEERFNTSLTDQLISGPADLSWGGFSPIKAKLRRKKGSAVEQSRPWNTRTAEKNSDVRTCASLDVFQ